MSYVYMHVYVYIYTYTYTQQYSICGTIGNMCNSPPQYWLHLATRSCGSFPSVGLPDSAIFKPKSFSHNIERSSSLWRWVTLHKVHHPHARSGCTRVSIQMSICLYYMCNSHLIHQQKVTMNAMQQNSAETSTHSIYRVEAQEQNL